MCLLGPGLGAILLSIQPAAVCDLVHRKKLWRKRNRDVIEWHRRLGHLDYTGMCKLKTAGRWWRDIHFSDSKQMLKLSGRLSCAEGKQSENSFGKSDAVIDSNDVLDLLHMDICGPMSTKSFSCEYHRWFLKDIFLFHFWVRSRRSSKYSFKFMAEYQTGHKIKHIRTDNGFVSMTPMIKICTEAGIVHDKTIHAPIQWRSRADELDDCWTGPPYVGRRSTQLQVLGRGHSSRRLSGESVSKPDSRESNSQRNLISKAAESQGSQNIWKSCGGPRSEGVTFEVWQKG